MSVALPTSITPSQSSTMQRRFRVLRADFGNGVEQTAPNGSNNAVEEWRLVYENIDSTAYATLVTNFLATLTGSEIITWSGKNYKIGEDGYSIATHSGSIWTVAFNLRQVF